MCIRDSSKTDATFAQDILPDLVEKPAPAPVAPVVMAAPAPAPVADPPMRVFSGPSDAKEFKF